MGGGCSWEFVSSGLCWITKQRQKSIAIKKKNYHVAVLTGENLSFLYLCGTKAFTKQTFLVSLTPFPFLVITSLEPQTSETPSQIPDEAQERTGKEKRKRKKERERDRSKAENKEGQGTTQGKAAEDKPRKTTLPTHPVTGSLCSPLMVKHRFDHSRSM